MKLRLSIPFQRVGTRSSRGTGFTFVEMVVAASATTIIGGVLLGLVSSMNQAFSAKTALSELSGYADVVLFQLKRDVWNAVRACDAGTGIACTDPLTVGAGLALDASPQGWGNGADVRYDLDINDLANPRLIRRQWNGGGWGAPWTVAQRVLAPPQSQATADAQGVTVSLWMRRSVLGGRNYDRSITNVRYHFRAS